MATLSENKMKTAAMFANGKSIAEIALTLKKSRQCIYNWLRLDDVIIEIEQSTKRKNELNEEYTSYINNMKKLANSNDENVALEANMFLLNLKFNNS